MISNLIKAQQQVALAQQRYNDLAKTEKQRIGNLAEHAELLECDDVEILTALFYFRYASSENRLKMMVTVQQEIPARFHPKFKTKIKQIKETQTALAASPNKVGEVAGAKNG